MRKRGGPAISLFSFQDIITSVMGILLFVALMLALRLKTVASDAVVATQEETVDDEIRELMQRKADLEQEFARWKAIMNDLDAVSPAMLSTMRTRIQELEQQLRATEERTEKEFAQHNQDIRDYSQEVASLQNNKRTLDEELARAKDDLHRLTSMSELTFNVSGFESSNRYVLDMHPTAWRLTLLNPAQNTSVIAVWGGTIAARRVKALQWCDQRGPNDYVLLLVRPSAIVAFREIVERLRQRSIPLGFEPLGEDQEMHLTAGS